MGFDNCLLPGAVGCFFVVFSVLGYGFFLPHVPKLYCLLRGVEVSTETRLDEDTDVALSRAAFWLFCGSADLVNPKP